MANPPLRLSGIFPPIPTPFGESGEILFDRLEENLDRWNTEPISGYVVGGSNGEFPLLTIEERVEVVRRVRRRAAADRLVVAGSGMESTRGTSALTGMMAEAGADAAIVVTPGYYKGRMTSGALIAHYQTIADQSALPLILYNVPANTGVDLSAEAAIELSRHPRIIGMKDSAGDVVKLARIASESAAGFQVLAGSAGFFLAGLAVGAVGLVAALANVAASALDELLRAFRAGKLDQARAIQARLLQANSAVTSRYGVPGLKAAMDVIGMYGGPPRMPLLPLEDHDREIVRAALLGAGIEPGSPRL
jgi:4-hydroxy-2-oxoglutarate aldolase